MVLRCADRGPDRVLRAVGDDLQWLGTVDRRHVDQIMLPEPTIASTAFRLACAHLPAPPIVSRSCACARLDEGYFLGSLSVRAGPWHAAFSFHRIMPSAGSRAGGIPVAAAAAPAANAAAV